MITALDKLDPSTEGSDFVRDHFGHDWEDGGFQYMLDEPDRWPTMKCRHCGAIWWHTQSASAKGYCGQTMLPNGVL